MKHFHRIIKVFVSLLLLHSVSHDEALSQQQKFSLDIQMPSLVLKNVPFDIQIIARDNNDHPVASFSDTLRVTTANGSQILPVIFENGTTDLKNMIIPLTGFTHIKVSSSQVLGEKKVRALPAWLSLMPALVAITLALLIRQVLIALLAGIWLGAIFVYDYSIFLGLLHTFDSYIIDVLADRDHISILIFSLTLGGMVGVMTRGGGTSGMVERIAKYARTAQSGQVATWLMGLLIFFDDYANTLIVGNTMRPITDRLKISREKLSYIVDSTAAPLAAIVPISTWIGYEVGLLDQVFSALDLELNPYAIFISAIPFSTYSILALIFVLMVAISRRDFGPMLKAEKRALFEDKVLSDDAVPLADTASLENEIDENIPKNWYNGFVPILVIIVVTITGLYYSGVSALAENAKNVGLQEIISNANSYAVLIWAAFAGLITAMAMITAQRILPLAKVVDAAISGYRSMMLAAFILTLAWAIGKICTDLHTADYVLYLTKDFLTPAMLPAATFLIAAAVSFATGSSWATMAIMIPIVMPLAHQLPIEHNLTAELSTQILFGTTGVIFGDHCSPISDTTVMSSMASAADHIDHVKTQLPYALVVSLVALLTGFIPAGFGWGGWNFSGLVLLLIGVLLLAGFLFLFGKRVDDRAKS